MTATSDSYRSLSLIIALIIFLMQSKCYVRTGMYIENAVGQFDEYLRMHLAVEIVVSLLRQKILQSPLFYRFD